MNNSPPIDESRDYQKQFPQLVVCAAIRHQETGFIICGPRHGDCLNTASRFGMGDSSNATWECGFADQSGTFLTRSEAWVVADKAGQIRRPSGFELHYGYHRKANIGDSSLLFSENLY